MLFISLSTNGIISISSQDEISGEKNTIKFEKKEDFYDFLKDRPFVNTIFEKFKQRYNFISNNDE